jgi:3-oxoacyl-[acyl-carrier protein] reductase
VVDTPTDVTEAAQVGALIKHLKALRKIDVLVNVAGTVSFGAAATLPEAEWERVLAVNLKAHSCAARR